MQHVCLFVNVQMLGAPRQSTVIKKAKYGVHALWTRSGEMYGQRDQGPEMDHVWLMFGIGRASVLG